MGRRHVMGAAAMAAAVVVLVGCKPIEAKESKYTSGSDSQQQGQNKSQGNGANTNSAQVVVVRKGDTLYGIAKRECGSGAAVDALAAANLGRVQPDGSVFTDPGLLKPGYEVVISCQTVSQ